VFSEIFWSASSYSLQKGNIVKEKLEQALVEVIKKTQDTVSSGVDFLTAQIPDVVHQLLVFKLVEAVLIIIGCLLVLGALAWMDYRIYQSIRKNDKWEFIDHPEMVFHLLQIVPILGTLFPLISYTKTALMIWLAPKLYLIEYAANLVN
jgi:hypothetical protein